LLQKLSEFLIIRLQRRKNIHTAFLDYNLPGILTNHRWFSEQTESLEKNETLFHLLINSRNLDNNELKQTIKKNYHSVRGLPFMPDLVVTNKIFNNSKRVDLINEIKHTGIPLVSLWDDLSFMNINYKICSNINTLTQLFFTLLITKIILKSIITRHYTFKIKSFIEKTNFKKKIFNTSLVTKKKEKTIIKKISFINN
jgi:ribosomal protein S2